MHNNIHKLFSHSSLSVLISATVGSSMAVAASDPIFDMSIAQLEEVLVTAQKRSESVQDVPIAISAFSSDKIESINAQSIDDLGKFTPGLETDVTNKTQPSFKIRGINSTSFGSGEDPSVATYIDGVYIARSGGALINFADVDRVEILKGPQGTLFGRNAAMGAVSVFSKRPVMETEGKIKLTFGSDSRRDIDAVYNTALTSDLAVRGVVSIQRDDGIYDRNGGSDLEQDDSQTFNLGFLYTGVDNTDIWLKLDYNKLSLRNSSDASTNPTINPEAVAGDPQKGAFIDRDTDVKPVENRELFGANLTIDHQINDNLTLKSITAYREYKTDNFEDEDGGSNPFFFAGTDNIEEQEQYSQEFIFSYVDEKLKWTAGLNWFKEDTYQDHVIEFNRQTIEQLITTTVLDLQGFPVNDNSGYDLITGTANPVLAGTWAAIAGGAQDLLLSGMPMGTTLPYTLGDGLGVFLASRGDSFGVDLATRQAIAAGIGTGALASSALFNIDTTNSQAANQKWVERTNNVGQNESQAIFGDVTYSVTDRIDVTAGARYSKEEKEFEVSTSFMNFIGTTPVGLAFSRPGSLSDSEAWEEVTARLVGDYKFNEDVLFYLSWATGFKSGSFASFIAGPTLESVDPEEVENVELGIKSTWLDGRLRVNASIYDFKFDDKQELTLTDQFTSNQLLPLYFYRQSDLEGDGFEIEVTWLATDRLLIAANYGHNETEYTDYGLFEGETDMMGNPLADPDSPTGTTDREGEPSTTVPEDKYNIFVEYTLPLSNGSYLVTNVSHNWTDDRTGTNPNEKIDDYSVTNMRIAYRDDDSKIEVAAWAKNLTDEEYVYDIGGTGGAIGSDPVSRGPGRTWGVDLIYSF